MSFYDDASLIMIPSGYKASKLYCAKPTDGSGDLTFSRTGSTATRVNESGLIEKCLTNLLNYSEQFDNAYWTKNSATITQNNGVAPDGTISADKIIGTAGVSTPQISRNTTGVTASTPYTLSVFAKKGEYSFVYLQEASVGNGISWFDLENGVIGTKQVDITSSKITSFSNGWYKCEMTFNQSGTTNRTRIGVSNANNVTSFTNDGTSGILIWGAQLEIGDIATAYIPTTSAAVTVGPIANLPRLDYTGGGCPKLLMEPTRTNVLTYSEQLNNVIWDKTGTTITSNATTSPDGYTNADKIVATSATGTKFTFQFFTSTIGVSYTASAFFKASEYNYVFFRLGGQTGNLYVIYNLSTQAVISTSGMISTTITSAGNGWYRITATVTANTVNLAPVFMVIPSTGYTLNAQNIPEFTGDNVSGGFIWGAQLEAGAYATSYIPTNNATVTRNIDSAIKTSATALIGQTEGTLYSEINISTLPGILNRDVIFISDGTTNNTVHIGFSHTLSNTITARVVLAGVVLATIDSAVLSATGTYKVAMAYKLNDIVFYINGVQIGVDTSAVIPACSQLNIGSNITPAASLSDGIKSSVVFKTRLSNSQLAILTTL